MISLKSLELDWLESVSKKNRNADKILVEKVVRALLLLEGLAVSKLNFTFKGGTALMLLLASEKRLSIDIDIVVEKRLELDKILSDFIQEKGFTRLEVQHRKTTSIIEKIHYKFFYKPSYDSNKKEDNILLDILFEKTAYQQIIQLPIDSSFVLQEGAAIKVNIPSHEDLLGDKLTAFAPNTTGIPYEKGGFSTTMEIIKQLYDIGNLFDKITNIQIVSTTFKYFAIKTLLYRGMDEDISLVLEDIVETALCISTRGVHGKGDFKALQKGISSIKAFIFSESYHIEKAIVQAAKAAYLVQLIKLNKHEIERFETPLAIKDWVIHQPFYTKLNKLKKNNPEAFFYWYKFYELI